MVAEMVGFVLVVALTSGAGDGVVAKRLASRAELGPNLVKRDGWRPWREGFERQGELFLCDNGSEPNVQRGASQTVVLNQREPRPIVATAWSKAEGVGGSRNNDYSLYLDLTYSDGTPLWGQTAPFETGSHDWERRKVVVVPEKPIKAVSVNLLLRRHTGRAWFRDAELRELRAPKGGCIFDGVPVIVEGEGVEGFQVRDVAGDSDFVRIEREALGLKLEAKRSRGQGATFIEATVADTSGRDRAITLVYGVPVRGERVRWFADPRRSETASGRREYGVASRFRAGTGRLSRYPFAAVGADGRGLGVGIDMMRPAFFRVGYNAGSGELFVAYDIGLAPEKPQARVRLCVFEFEPSWGFRSALARYWGLFREQFRRRVRKQGLWMPFARISKVRGWGDFGFRFKEGTNETAWDDAHDILTFRYTEPLTWWMRMGRGAPRTLAAALAEARALAEKKGDPRARALFTSGYHDERGEFFAHLLKRPWCDGAVWSINSMPGIAGEVTDFKNKWNRKLKETLYGPGRKADLDGEYIDSSEGYVTLELDYRRDHFSAADTPLTFGPEDHRPAIFRGLIAFEYVRAIARDVHAMGKLTMANGTPGRLCWLAPLLDVLGTETNWNPGGRWRPMSDAELLYRRSLCGGKPYCFLMNTRFEDFGPELVERYMKRALAYGMFPGFFSANASQGHYFTRPELYERDRRLFRKYVPLCKRVAEAGWEPITLARSDDPRVHVERFGARYLTVFNDSPEPRTATIAVDFEPPGASRELVSGKTVAWRGRQARLRLGAEDVAVLDVAR